MKDAPPGWYSEPLSRKPGLQRWWDGQVWTNQTRRTVDGEYSRSEEHPIARHASAITSDSSRSSSSIGNRMETAGLILSALTLFFLIFNFGELVLGVLEILCALSLVVVATVVLLNRRHQSPRSILIAALQVVLGLCGIGWFVRTAIIAVTVYVNQHS